MCLNIFLGLIMIKVLLADDHGIVRAGIRSVIERQNIKVICEADNGEEVFRKIIGNEPDIFILDISMPVLNGLETAERLIRDGNNRKIIILSMHDEKTYVEKAVKVGVKGYILKESAIDEIYKAITEVNKGNFYISPKVSQYIINGFLFNNMSDDEKESSNLTIREKEVLQMIAEGLSSKEIAVKLCLSLNTVQVHRKNIMRKCDVHKGTDLVKLAIKEGLIKV